MSENDKSSEEFDNSIVAEPIPEIIRRNVSASMLNNADLRWFDARTKSGPSPSDFGEHEAIPEEAVVAMPVVVAPPTIIENKGNLGK